MTGTELAPDTVVVPDARLYIDGRWSSPSDRELVPVHNPATEQVIGSVIECTRADIDAAFAAARQALGPWAATTVEHRAELLDALADALHDRGEELAVLARWRSACR